MIKKKSSPKGCGIIPYSVHNNKVYFLCGIDYNDKISDLGGKIDKGESAIDCAVREFYEESVGLFANKKDIKKFIQNGKKNKNTKIIKLGADSCYITYMIKSKYEPIITDAYEILYKYIKNCDFVKYDEGYFEMKSLKWIDYDTLKKHVNTKNKIIDRRFFAILKIISKKYKLNDFM